MIVTETVSLETTICCVCGCTFAIPADMIRKRRENRESFYCPNGHSLSFTESTVNKLEKELVREKAKTDQALADAKWQRERHREAEKSIVAYKGNVTKLKNRIGAGVCPCCNRSFIELASHMLTKHPGFRKEDAGAPLA